MGSGQRPGTEIIGVDVPGGAIAVEVVSQGTEPVLAIHGISSQRKLWNWLRAAEPGLSLIAPDLRGRGHSIGAGGPSSIGRHAADMVAVLDRLGLDAVHVCGMSMGGFVAVELATAFPGRVKSLILVDGGFPMAAPPGLTPEVLPAVFADRLARLDREWSSVSEYARFFIGQTAPLLDPADPLLLDCLAHDLAGGRVRLSAEALIGDATDISSARRSGGSSRYRPGSSPPSGASARTAPPRTPPRPSLPSGRNSTRWSRCTRCPASTTPRPS
jgi:pimeloyl-ACP methyl ester carboxylesterase